MSEYPTENEVKNRTDFMIRNIKISPKYRHFISEVIKSHNLTKEQMDDLKEFTDLIVEYNKSSPNGSIDEETFNSNMLNSYLGQEYCKYYNL